MQENAIALHDNLYDIWYKPLLTMQQLIIISILGIILLGMVIWYWIVNKKKNIAEEPGQLALNRLKALNLDLFEDPENHPLFYTELTIIIKHYLSQRYTLDLTGKTDKEVITLIKQTPFPPDFYDALMSILQGAEFIKFAHQEAQRDHMRYDLKRTIDIIRNTISITPARNSSESRSVAKRS